MDVKMLIKSNLSPLSDGETGKDWHFSSLMPDLKKFEHQEKILKEITSVSNQRWLPSCTANATCDAFEYVYKDKIDLSRMFVYWTSRPMKNQLTGVSLRSSLDSIRVFGVPPEVLWPYDLEKVNDQPSEESFRVAKDRRKTTYYRVKENDEIVAAINAGWPVLFSIQLDKSFEIDPISPDHIFDGKELTNSYHSMIVVGYRYVDSQLQFRVRNSWGPNWCDKGYCWFTSEYLKSRMMDAWAITNYIPNESIVSKRNVEFAITTLMAAFFVWMMFVAKSSGQMESSAVTGGFVSSGLLQVFGIWRRWWLNITINDKLPFGS